MASNRNVLYVDFGYSTAREMWDEVGLPAYQRFKVQKNRATAIESAVHAWHIHEWVWHQDNPGTDSQQNPAYRQFRGNLLATCPELAWVRDIADATKHRGLGRPINVQRINPAVVGKPLLIGSKVLAIGGKVPLFGSADLSIELTDGSRYAIADVLETVVTFWQDHFEKASLQPSKQSL